MVVVVDVVVPAHAWVSRSLQCLSVEKSHLLELSHTIGQLLRFVDIMDIVFDSLEELTSFLKDFLIISKYLRQPFLVDSLGL